MKKSDLPFGSEFSPSQIDLKSVLEFAARHAGDYKAFENRIREQYFADYATSQRNKAKLANNCKLGMIAYGIIDRHARLTSFGEELYRIRHKPEQLYAKLARHILLHVHGLTLVQCIADMQAAGETVTLTSLRTWLKERGIHFPPGGKHPSIMRLWLEKAGVFKQKWQIDESRLNSISGIDLEEIEVIAQFSPEQKAYLRTLVNIGTPGPFQSNEIQRLAAVTYGVKYDEKNLPKQVLYPLVEAGYINLKRGTKAAGRGAKPFYVTPTKKFEKDLLSYIIAQLEEQVRSDLRPYLRRMFSEILHDMHSRNRHKKGLALEALGIKLLRLLDLDYMGTRLRGQETGGAEVDLIFESARLVYSRWQIQCKNTKRVSLDDVAKEVGLTHLLKSNVIVLLTTGKVGSEAMRYARKVMQDTNLFIVAIEQEDIKAIIESPAHIANVFNRQAREAMRIKELKI